LERAKAKPGQIIIFLHELGGDSVTACVDGERFERYISELCASVGLDVDAWDAWSMAREQGTPQDLEAKPTPYHLTLGRLPMPPCDPSAALAQAEGRVMKLKRFRGLLSGRF
jgi:hypothetical protein